MTPWALSRLCRRPLCRKGCRPQHWDPPTLYVSAKMSSFSILRSASFLASSSSVPSLYKRCNSRGCTNRAQLPINYTLLLNTILAAGTARVGMQRSAGRAVMSVKPGHAVPALLRRTCCKSSCTFCLISNTVHVGSTCTKTVTFLRLMRTYIDCMPGRFAVEATQELR